MIPVPRGRESQTSPGDFGWNPGSPSSEDGGRSLRFQPQPEDGILGCWGFQWAREDHEENRWRHPMMCSGAELHMADIATENGQPLQTQILRDAPDPQPDREQHDSTKEVEQRQEPNQHAFVRGRSLWRSLQDVTNSSPVRQSGDPTVTLPIWSSASSFGRAGTTRARCGTRSQSGSNH